jgi:glycosyltransferase involved in cell wall biosynthesis
MADGDTPSVVWAHRGLGTDLWVRLTAPEAGELVLRRPDHEDTEVALGVTVPAGPSDLTLDLPATLEAAGDVVGWWRLELVVADTGDRVPVVGRSRTGLRPVPALLDGAPYELRFHPKGDEDAGVEVVPHAPWAEVTCVELDGTTLTVEAELPPTATTPSVATWRRRGDPDSGEVAVPVATADRAVTCHSDLAALVPAEHGDDWDLTLECGDERVALGWHRDDVIDKQHAVVLPTATLPDATPPRVVEPRFTRSNQLVARIHHLHRGTAHDTRDRSRRANEEEAPPQRQRIARSGDREAPPPTLVHRALAAVARWVFAVLEARTRRQREGVALDAAGPVHLLIANAFGVGGTVRTTFNTANALAKRRPVSVVSAYRLEERRYFDLDPGVTLRTLVDYLWMETRPVHDPRSWLRRLALRAPSVLVHGEDPRAHRFDLWTDIQLVRWIRSVRNGTIVATRPGLNVAIARFARPGVVRIGQQHLPYEFTSDELWQHVLPHYRDLHALTALTEADAQSLRHHLEGSRTRVVRLPNPLAGIDPPTSPLTRPCIIAAGRYSRTKGVDLLIDAFAEVARHHPDWELRIYGQGKPRQKEKLRRQIRELGLTDQVRLMLVTPRLELEMSKASICAVSSRFEAFGMVIIEAMSCGMPVVSFDCPHGPREIITDGVDGVLVPPEDTAAFGAALRRLIEDEDERRRLAAGGLRTAARYAPDRVVARLEDLIAEVAAEPAVDAGRA